MQLTNWIFLPTSFSIQMAPRRRAKTAETEDKIQNALSALESDVNLDVKTVTKKHDVQYHTASRAEEVVLKEKKTNDFYRIMKNKNLYGGLSYWQQQDIRRDMHLYKKWLKKFENDVLPKSMTKI